MNKNTDHDMKFVEMFEANSLKDTKFSQEEAQKIFSAIEKSVKDGEAWELRYTGEFGKDPNSKKFKIGQISATTFELLVSITDQKDNVVCYAGLGYDTLKHKFKEAGKTYIWFVDTKDSRKFGQYGRRFKQTVYQDLNKNEEKIQEDFAAVGAPPAGNVSGMGSVTAPTPGHLGSGDSWPSLGTPAVGVPITSAICPLCKKSKKACTCEDSPSEKKKKKLKKIKVNEMKHITKYENFLSESKKTGQDYMMYMDAFSEALEEKVPSRHFQIKDVEIEDAKSDDFKGSGWGEGSFVLNLDPVNVSFSYEIETIKDYGDETADIDVHIQFDVAESKYTKAFDHPLKKQSLPDFEAMLRKLVKEDLAKLAKDY